MIRGTFEQRSASCPRLPASVSAFAADNLQKFTLSPCVAHRSMGRGQPTIREMLVFAALHESGSGPLRQILQRERMSVFGVIADVAARCFKGATDPNQTPRSVPGKGDLSLTRARIRFG
jgi:hypothetical protein